jgi:ATP synthase protein I
MPADQKSKRLMEDWGKYGSIGVEMLASVLVGAFGGYGLDRLFHTKPWLMIVGFILGSIAGFRSLFRLLKEENKEKRD